GAQLAGAVGRAGGAGGLGAGVGEPGHRRWRLVSPACQKSAPAGDPLTVSSPMEAATPLFATSAVRVLGDRLLVDGLVVEDEAAVRLAREAEDAARFVRDAVEIGARVLDREHTEAGVEVFRIEAEKAEAAVAEQARAGAQFFNDKVDEAL